MGGILNLIGKLFGRLMLFVYNTIGFNNYALSLVLMTVIYKLILLPISINQSKSTLKMRQMQPELQRIQERYKNDRERLQEEQVKFYQEQGYNPMKGCLPTLIQFPIIIALFYVIRMPMAYMLKTPATAVTHMAIQSVESGYLKEASLKDIDFKDLDSDELSVTYLQETYQQMTKKDPYIEIKILEAADRNPNIIENNPYLSEEQADVLQGLDLRMFKVFNLGVKPTFNLETIKSDPAKYIPPIVLLLIAVVTTYITTAALMGMQNKKSKEKNAKNSPNAGCAENSMLWVSPIMTIVIGSQTPSGLAVYWTINGILGFAQQFIINKFYGNDTGIEEQDQQKETIEQLDSKKQQGSNKQISGKTQQGSKDQQKPKAQKEEKKSAKVNNKRGKKRR